MSTRFSVVEGINTDTNSNWSVSSRLDISSATEVVKALGVSTNHLMCYSDSAVLFRFDLISSNNQINANNDVIMPAGTLFTIRVPHRIAPEDGGDDEVIYFHVKQVDSVASKYLRLVEC
jgi:hypothetical protein